MAKMHGQPKIHFHAKKRKTLCCANARPQFITKSPEKITCKNCKQLHDIATKPSGPTVKYRILAIDKHDAEHDFIIFVPWIRGKKIRQSIIDLSQKKLPHPITELNRFWFGSPTNETPKEFFKRK